MIHYPANSRQLKAAENRIVFEEFFFLQLRLIKQYLTHKKDLKGHPFDEVGKVFNRFYHDHLPFELTGAQKRVIREIRRDLGSGRHRSEEHTSELQSRGHLVCRLLLDKKKH